MVWTGLNWSGLDWIVLGLDWIDGQNWIRPGLDGLWPGLGWIELNSVARGLDWVRLDWIGLL